MRCPKCGNKMKVIKNDISNNGKKGEDYKEYERVVYKCEQDDVWINVEVPKINL